jgi:hypothetical protein
VLGIVPSPSSSINGSKSSLVGVVFPLGVNLVAEIKKPSLKYSLVLLITTVPVFPWFV